MGTKKRKYLGTKFTRKAQNLNEENSKTFL